MKLSYPIAQLTTRGMLLVILAVAWIMGILIDSTLPPRPCLLLSGLILLFLITFWQKQRYRLLFLLLLCISLGSWRYSRELPQFDLQRELPQFDLPSVQRFIGPTSSLGIRGVVSDEPKLQTRTRLLMIKVNAVQISGNSPWENAAGNIEVITLFNGSSAEDPYGANYGDSVELHGKLLPPTTTSSRDAVASMSFPRVHVSANSGNVLIASIYHQRNQLATLIEQALPQPEAALLIAIFLGLRTPALRPLAFAFNVTGTAHLIVPSGFKVTILSGLVARPIQHLLQKTSASFPPGSLHKRWRDWIKIILVLLSIALYTMLSGAGPAALRA